MKRIASVVLLVVMWAGISTAQNFNFSNTTPAPPAGGTNVLWQKDSNSTVNVSAYIATGVFAKLGAANTFGAFQNSFAASTWLWPACVAGVSSATNQSCLDAGTGAHVWNPFTSADVLIGSGGGSNIITLINAVNQGTGSTGGSSGVSVSCSYPFVAANSYAQKGDGTHPQLGMAQFQTPGALVSTATGVRMDCAFTMPSNYTANSNITVKGLAGCVLAGGPYSVTVSSNYSDITLGGALNSTLSADFSSASTSVATVPALTAFTLTITSPTVNPGDLVSISTRISSDASGCAPVVPQLIASY